MKRIMTEKKKAKYRLSDLEVKEVSLVGRPAIGKTYLLTKAADSVGLELNDEDLEQSLQENGIDTTEKAETKREQGYDFPAAAFAYVPDPSKTSSWKLRLWETPTKKVTRRQVGMAVAALGKGFRGKKVQIPSGDIAKVKAKVRAAWRSVHESGEELPAVLKEAGTVPVDNLGVENMNEKLVELLKSVELSDEIREALAGAMDTIVNSEVPVEIMKGFYDLAGYEVPTKEVEVVKEVEVEKIVEVPVEKEEEPEKEEVLKGLDPKVLALFKENETRAERAEKAAAEAFKAAEAEKDARINKEYIQKAAEKFDYLSIEADKLGPVLKAMDEKLSEEEREVLKSVFETAKGALTLSRQDEEFGTAVAKGDTTLPEWEKKAKAMVEKGEAKTAEQAVAKLVETNPELFPGGGK